MISLLGPDAGKAIERSFSTQLAPEQWSARELRCGDASAFQGSERDVMFLSMVKRPDPSRRISHLLPPIYVQRYNVAVSRAKDQFWVFHSIP